MCIGRMEEIVAVVASFLSVLHMCTDEKLELVAVPPAKQPRKCRVCENDSGYHLLSVKLVGASHHLCGLVGLDL